MKKILFITSRNILNTCGELRLIKNRSCALKDTYGIETIFYCYVNESKLHRQREEIYENCDLNIYTYKSIKISLNVRSYLLFIHDIIKRIREDSIDNIIISGVFPTILSKRIKSIYPKIKITFDIHSANEELLEFKTRNIKNRVVYQIVEHYTRKSFKYVDNVMVVSNALKQYLQQKMRAREKNRIEFFIIPCSLTNRNILYDYVLNCRKKWRNELGINDDEILFIYSGGISPWQSIDEMKEIYNKFKQKYNNKCKLLIMSNRIEELSELKSEEDVILRSFLASQVEEVLYAGDIAMLIRGDYITNHVAFPNKFLEYVLSNMIIVSTPYIYDVANYITENKIGILIDKNNMTNLNEIDAYITGNIDKRNEFSKRLEFVNSISFERLLKPFYKYLISCF